MKKIKIGNKTILSYQEYLHKKITLEDWADDFLKIIDKSSVAETILFSDVKMMIDFISDLLKLKIQN